MPDPKFPIDYKNLDGLLTLCLVAKLVEVDKEKKHWVITRKFGNLINDQLEKDFPPGEDDEDAKED